MPIGGVSRQGECLLSCSFFVPSVALWLFCCTAAFREGVSHRTRAPSRASLNARRRPASEGARSHRRRGASPSGRARDHPPRPARQGAVGRRPVVWASATDGEVSPGAVRIDRVHIGPQNVGLDHVARLAVAAVPLRDHDDFGPVKQRRPAIDFPAGHYFPLWQAIEHGEANKTTTTRAWLEPPDAIRGSGHWSGACTVLRLVWAISPLGPSLGRRLVRFGDGDIGDVGRMAQEKNIA